jgi:hypothetical protein
MVDEHLFRHYLKEIRIPSGYVEKQMPTLALVVKVSGILGKYLFEIRTIPETLTTKASVVGTHPTCPPTGVSAEWRPTDATQRSLRDLWMKSPPINNTPLSGLLVCRV